MTTGWPAVEAKAAELGIRYDPWQQGAGKVILGKRRNGKYAATVGGVTLSIPRQVGKTFFVGTLIIVMCVLFPGLRVLWTAHHGATTANTFATLQGICRRRAVWPHIARNGIRMANGQESIRFANGSLILFGAREHGFGRGMDAIDVEVFDEAQILKSKTLEDMVPATNQARHPHGALLFFMGTPPRPEDPGEEFTRRRDRALAGESKDGVYIEFSADADADPDDREQWAKANPSYPLRTPHESMLRMRENLGSDEAWLREALGVWAIAGAAGAIPMDLWMAAGDEQSVAADRWALGVEVGPDLGWASVALAGLRADGRWHVELDERRDGTAWVAPYVAALCGANPQIRAVAADAGSPTAALFDDFAREKVRLTTPKVAELGGACATLLQAVVVGQVRHIRQPQLDVAVSVAGKRPLGDTGMWVFSRKLATSDITPVQAVNLALWAAQAPPKRVARPVRRGAETRKAVML